ncbi:DUF4214 domain-containing protein [Pseudoduganella sp. FT55W]|uniref:DUF4214 domain-containing protein n=1 Tax=Duganella rivi TaxID=2666083 RepID=A0A7X4KFK7_9BURK|nr:DUF4214 domain-containing protein [Duganella rivi]MYM70568.1 DUF4214 domain-containing protein [Duganella rivi]
MKNLVPLASLALLLTACGGSSDTPSNPARAPQALRSAAAVPAAADYTQLTQSLYIGFFGRPADAGGLAYWSKIFADRALPQNLSAWLAGYGVNTDITIVLDAMVNSVEAQDLYVSNNASYINAIYQNGFNRYSEAGGREYWAGLIDQRILTRAQAVMSILGGAQNGDAQILAKKVQAASIFTSLLSQPGAESRKLTYGTGGYSDGARDLLGRVTAATDIQAFRADIEAFVATMDEIPGNPLVVRRYVGYHYLQSVNNQPLYAAGYSYQLPGYPPYLPNGGKLTYGAEPQSIDWTRSDEAGYVYGAPVAASATIIASNKLPAVSMLCSPVVTANGTVTKSTDVLVARTAWRLSDASELAGQKFTVYRENCAVGGSNVKSFKFEADGSGVFPVANGVLTFDAASVSAILNGQVLPDLSTGKFIAFSAYLYTRTNGELGYFIVQHLGNHKAGVTDGVLAIWAQE